MVSIIWFLNHHMVPLYGFSIIIWNPKIWFLNQNLVNYMFPNQTSAFSRYSATVSIIWFLNHYMVSQSLYGFSIIIWFLNHYMVSIIWFLNHYMVSIIWFPLYGFHYMVSRSLYGFHYMVSIIWFLNHHMVPLYGSIIWFLNHHMISQNMVSQSKFGKLYVSKSDKCV